MFSLRLNFTRLSNRGSGEVVTTPPRSKITVVTMQSRVKISSVAGEPRLFLRYATIYFFQPGPISQEQIKKHTKVYCQTPPNLPQSLKSKKILKLNLKIFFMFLKTFFYQLNYVKYCFFV